MYAPVGHESELALQCSGGDGGRSKGLERPKALKEGGKIEDLGHAERGGEVGEIDRTAGSYGQGGDNGENGEN